MKRGISKMEGTTPSTKAIFLALIISAIFASCHKDGNNNKSPTSGSTTNFARVNLVSNNSQDSGVRLDSNLMNGWGITFSPTGNLWVCSEGGGVSLIYDATGNQVLPPISIPAASAATGGQP